MKRRIRRNNDGEQLRYKLKEEDENRKTDERTIVCIVGAKKATTLQTKELWCARQSITMPKGEHLRARDYDNRADDDETRGRVYVYAHVKRNPPGRPQ